MKLNRRAFGTMTVGILASAIVGIGAAAQAATVPDQDAAAPPVRAATHPSHEAHAHEHAAAGHDLSLNDGKKWETDAPLRQGMSKMKAALVAQLPALRSESMTDAQYDALAGEVDTQIAYMVENCKLDPEPDEVLHVLLGEAAAGSEALKGEDENASRSAGIAKVIGSLQRYGEYFDHPGWKAPELHIQRGGTS